MGRDPITSPLTELELALFNRALYEIVEAEYSSSDEKSEYKDASAVGPDDFNDDEE